MPDYENYDTEILKIMLHNLQARHSQADMSRFKINSLDVVFEYEDFGDSLIDRELSDINARIRAIKDVLLKRI